MGFETTITPLMTTQVTVYAQPAATFSAADTGLVFGEKPRTQTLDQLVPEPQYGNKPARDGWIVYDEKHLYHPHSGRSLDVAEQGTVLSSYMKGRRYGEFFSSRLLPQLVTTRPMWRLEKMKAHLLELQDISFILEAMSPAGEFLFRRVGRPNWSGWGEDHLIVFKKEGEWVAECQSVPTQSAYVDNIGDGTEDACFQFRVLRNLSAFWMTHEQAIPVHTTNAFAEKLPSVREVEEALRIMPPLLLGGLQSVELIDQQHENGYYGQMESTGILRLFRGSREYHLHATLFHELAHWFAMRCLGSMFLSGQAQWIRAIMQDARNPSKYATTTIGEDFAESVALYFLTGGGRFGAAPIYFRNRFRILDDWMHDCLQSPLDIAPNARLLSGGDHLAGEQGFNRIS